MATQVKQYTVCDPCDKEDGRETPADRTIRFSIGPVSYEIDVCEDPHGKEIDATLGALADLATKIPGSAHSRTTRTAPASSRYRPKPDREQKQAIRRWVREHHPDVSDRGRIPERYVKEYEDAHEHAA